MSTDTQQIGRLLVAELERLWRFAWRLTGHHADASDLVQRTCLRALERADQYQDRGKISSWLLRIMHNIWINEIRARNIRQQGAFSQLAGAQNQPETQDYASVDGQGFIEPESNLLLHQVHHEVEALPEAQRIVMLLICVEGYSYRESAEILDVPIGTIMSRLARARMTIGQAMQQSNAAKDDKAIKGVKF